LSTTEASEKKMSERKPTLYFLQLAGRTFSAHRVTGTEELSKPFRIEVRFFVPAEAPVVPASVVKTEAALVLRREIPLRTIDGVITDIKTRVTHSGDPEVICILEPRFALTRYRQDIRIFRELTAVEIVCQVLGGHGIAPELRLSKDYERRHYCVQFRESDQAFVHRLLEDEGIAYFFLEGDRMVLMDNPSAYEPIAGDPEVLFRPGSGLDRDLECITMLSKREVLVPSKATLRDFNPDTPRLDMDVSAPVPSPSGVEWYDYPGEYMDPAYGARKVALRAEAFDCASRSMPGESFCARLLPGGKLTIVDGPLSVPDDEYVITSLEHDFDREEEGFSNRFEALEAVVAFRPARVTEEPRLLNPITGFVTGPPGEDIYTDEWGRVRVHFHWDRLQPYDGECSFWIPVLQDNTGSSCGIPRIGWEVLVHFLEGDPDRPVVLGRVYNAKDEFPMKLPKNKTRSALRSLSSPDRGGQNEIQFEDLAGKQHIWVYAQKDQNVVIANDKRELVYNNETHTISRDEAITIGSNHTMQVSQSIKQQVGGNQDWTVGGSREQKVSSADSSAVSGNRTLNIGGMHFRRIGSTDVVQAENLTETVGGVILEASVNGNRTEANKSGTLAVGGGVVEIAKQNRSGITNKIRAELIGGLAFVKAKKEVAVRVNNLRRTQVGAMLKVSAKQQIGLFGVEKLSLKAAKHQVDGSTSITLKVGDTSVVMKGGAIAFTATSAIKMLVDGENYQGAGNSTQI